MEAVFRDCIDERRELGHTVLLSSHILAEVERLCDRVSIIRNGRTVETGTMTDLRHLTRTSITADLEVVPSDLGARPGVHGLDVDGSRIHLQVDAAHLPAVMACLGGAGVRSITSTPPTLEELFLRHYGDSPSPDPERVP